MNLSHDGWHVQTSVQLGCLKRCITVLAAVIFASLPSQARAQGLVQAGSGAMHLSMAGASTAAGVDALGALY